MKEDPQTMTDLLILLTDTETLKSARIHQPATENGSSWCFRHRHVGGLDSVFMRNGRRTVVDVNAFKAAHRSGLGGHLVDHGPRILRSCAPAGDRLGSWAREKSALQLPDR